MRVRFQFAPDGAEGGATEIVETPDYESSPFEDGDFEIKEVQEAESSTPSREEIAKELEAMKKANEELRARADQSDMLSKSFSSFGDRLEKAVVSPKPAQSIPAPAPGESLDDFRERINKKYLDDPYGTMVEFSNRYVGGALSVMAEQSAKLQKKIALLEAPDKDFVAKYYDEIDAEISRVPVEAQLRDPDVAKRAVDVVRARHMEEIIEARVAAKIAERGLTPPASPAPRPAGTPEASPSAPPSSGKREIAITPSKKNRILAAMEREGVPENKYKDYISWAIEDGTFDKI